MNSIEFAARGTQDASRRSRLRHGKDLPVAGHCAGRPRSYPPQPIAPGGRPKQPTGPLAYQSCLVRNDTVLQPATRPGRTEEGQWLFADRVLLAIILAFAFAVVLGATVIVNQYLALGATP